MRRYCHIGTGNYNPKTAKLYEDLGLLTADPTDRRRPHPAVQLPHRLRPQRAATASCSWRPHSLRQRLERADPTARWRRPAGTGRIVMKMNSLVDPTLIDALYEASQAGVEIDLIVRGICCLRPGVPGPVRATSGCARSSGATSSTRASTASPTAAVPGVPAVLHRLGRPHAPQPRPPGRGAGAGRRPDLQRRLQRDPRRRTWPTTPWPGRSDADGDLAPRRAPRTRSTPTGGSRSWPSPERPATPWSPRGSMGDRVRRGLSAVR